MLMVVVARADGRYRFSAQGCVWLETEEPA